MDSDQNAAGRGTLWIAAATLVLVACAGYANTLRVPFLFDDPSSIVDNPSLRTWSTALQPPGGGLPVSGRPVVNLTLAINYASGGLKPAGYHVFNLLFHATAGLLLFGLVRRTLPLAAMRRGMTRARRDEAATVKAFAVAVLWTAHPLLTEAVTYTVQRAEVLVALFYLLTLYGLARAATSATSRRWLVLSAVACLLGMATKEVMVSAPLIALAYDRVFIAGSWAEAWRRRRGYYVALGGTWLVLLSLVTSTGARGGTAGFGLNISPLAYALTQGEAIVRYLGLAVWPHPLVFDYNTYLTGFPRAVPFVVIIVGGAAATIAAWRRWPALGFVALAFWAILAPSSSIVPVATQTVAEHRMYLPLAAVITGGVLGLAHLFSRRGLVAVLAATAALVLITAARNHTYRSAVTLWGDTAAKRPENLRARFNFAQAALDAGDEKRALAVSGEYLQRAPESPDAHHNRALILLRTEQPAEAVEESRTAVRLRPSMADAEATWGVGLLQLGRAEEAIEHFRAALRLRPDAFEARNNLGSALLRLGHPAEALAEVQAALRLRPDSANAHNNLAEALRQLGRLAEAKDECEQALKLEPQFAEAHYTLGNIALQARRPAEAIAAFQAALARQPKLEAAQIALAGALVQAGRASEALPAFEQLTRAPTASFEAHYNYANALFQLERYGDAAAHYASAVALKPDSYAAHYNLGHALAAQDKPAEAIVHFRSAVRLRPDSVDANFSLGQALLSAGQAIQALPLFESVVRLAPDSAEGQAGLGDTLAELGRTAEAATRYETALRLNPTLPDIKERLTQLRRH